ncbi:MAG: hypothetical protein O9302_09970 [Cyclobacteriaceae bacterium]|nr:hypothetical protein [Cytophagales bacterium]MCZ8328374.1 hypothetical protein [Cyclobacteriaceae bacterium]
MKKNLDKNQLYNILDENSDFSDFINIHFSNIIVMRTLDESKSNHFKELLANRTLKIKELEEFLVEISFEKSALDHYENLLSYLNENYSYSNDDLMVICLEKLEIRSKEFIANQSISKTQINWAPILASICDIYCTQDAIDEYPEGGSVNGTERAVWYSGCMSGCGFGIKQKQK